MLQLARPTGRQAGNQRSVRVAVYSVPFDFKCSACGRVPAADGWGLCELCGRFFCSDHLVLKKGLRTCESCVPARERREAASAVTASDVKATIGTEQEQPIVEAAARRRLYADSPKRYVGDVVDEVQQFFHDAFVDTTWPSCPHHPNHPLWFSDGYWRCDRIEDPVAPLGGLSQLTSAK